MFAQDLARLRAVTPADVQRVASRWLNTQNRLIIRCSPETSGRESQQQVDRATPPGMGLDKPFTAPQVQTAALENGLQVLVVPKPELPLVAATLVTRAGSIADPVGKEGTAALTATVMPLGIPGRNALDIEKDLGNLGVDLGSAADRESSILSFSTLKRNLPAAMKIMAEVACRPTFPTEELERERKRTLEGLAIESSDPNGIAMRVAPMLIFGREHPYGHPTSGLPGTVAAIGREDLVAFHAARWRPASSALILVGDITMEQATAIAKDCFGSWTGAAAEAVDIPQVAPPGAGKVFIVDRKDAPQTAIVQAMPAPARATPDYYPLTLADGVWGGSFNSRLNLILREQKAYTYGAFSVLMLGSRAGAWAALTSVETDKTADTISEMTRILQGIAGGEPIKTEELEPIRTNLVRGYSQGFETLGGVAGKVGNLWALELPFDELQREPVELGKATLEQVNAAAGRTAVPGKSFLLLVGDRARIEGPARELKLGDVEVLDVEGRPVRGQ